MRINKSKWLLQQKLCFLSSCYSVGVSWLHLWKGAVNIIRISKSMATREFAARRAVKFLEGMKGYLNYLSKSSKFSWGIVHELSFQ